MNSPAPSAARSSADRSLPIAVGSFYQTPAIAEVALDCREAMNLLERFALPACMLFAGVAFAQSSSPDAGIPVTDPLVIAKCGNCHTRDERGNMQRISWERTTPEGWQEALKRMIVVDGVSLTPAEARSIVRYLSASHGLAPEEAKLVTYDAERRIHVETSIPNDSVGHACARCHSFAHALVWRRS